MGSCVTVKAISVFSIIFFLACSENRSSIKIKGSDTEVNLAVQLAESFHQQNPAILISISGGGSGLGIASLLNGTCDIANSSRSINQTEVDLFRDREIQLDSLVFAQDAIAFIVSEKLPLDSIDILNLGRILSGVYDNWSAITDMDIPITIYGRQSNSGTHEFISKKLNIHFSPYSKQMNGNAQILEAISNDNSGIGYVGAGYVIHGSRKGIKVLSIISTSAQKAISPLDREMILAGKYFFQRPLYQYYKSGSYNRIKPFLDFEKNSSGLHIISSAGYYPVKSNP